MALSWAVAIANFLLLGGRGLDAGSNAEGVAFNRPTRFFVKQQSIKQEGQQRTAIGLPYI